MNARVNGVSELCARRVSGFDGAAVMNSTPSTKGVQADGEKSKTCPSLKLIHTGLPWPCVCVCEGRVTERVLMAPCLRGDIDRMSEPYGANDGADR